MSRDRAIFEPLSEHVIVDTELLTILRLSAAGSIGLVIENLHCIVCHIDRIHDARHSNPLTVTKVGVREVSLIGGVSTRQYAISAEHDRESAVEHEFYEEINAADGEVIEIVDERGVPVRLFEVDE